jgi:hypothetical protein
VRVYFSRTADQRARTASGVVIALAPPPAIIERLGHLNQIERFSSLPPAIVAGSFSVDGTSAAGWRMAEPGGPFSATDVPVPGAPGRRLIFAACDAQLCLLHYERGGIAHFYEILALSRRSHGWTVIWNARGSKPLANLAALRTLLAHPVATGTWNQQRVKGDF